MAIDTDQLVSLLECSVCLDMLVEPMVLGCGHTYCRECVGQVSRTTDAPCCPVCRVRFSPHIPPVNRLVRDIVRATHGSAQYDARVDWLEKHPRVELPCLSPEPLPDDQGTCVERGQCVDNVIDLIIIGNLSVICLVLLCAVLQ